MTRNRIRPLQGSDTIATIVTLDNKCSSRALLDMPLLFSETTTAPFEGERRKANFPAVPTSVTVLEAATRSSAKECGDTVPLMDKSDTFVVASHGAATAASPHGSPRGDYGLGQLTIEDDRPLRSSGNRRPRPGTGSSSSSLSPRLRRVESNIGLTEVGEQQRHGRHQTTKKVEADKASGSNGNDGNSYDVFQSTTIMAMRPSLNTSQAVDGSLVVATSPVAAVATTGSPRRGIDSFFEDGGGRRRRRYRDPVTDSEELSELSTVSGRRALGPPSRLGGSDSGKDTSCPVGAVGRGTGVNQAGKQEKVLPLWLRGQDDKG